MKARCLRDSSHNEFYTVAHVVQTWKVDQCGNFLEEFSTDEVTHGPDSGNTWTCAICDSDAKVED